MTPTALLFAAAAHAAPAPLDVPTPQLGDPVWLERGPHLVLSAGGGNVRLADGQPAVTLEARAELNVWKGWALVGTTGTLDSGSRSSAGLRRRFGPHGVLHAGVGGGWQEQLVRVDVPESEDGYWSSYEYVYEEAPTVHLEAGIRAPIGMWQMGMVTTAEQPLGVANAYQVSVGAHVGRRFGGRTPAEREARRRFVESFVGPLFF